MFAGDEQQRVSRFFSGKIIHLNKFSINLKFDEG